MRTPLALLWLCGLAFAAGCTTAKPKPDPLVQTKAQDNARIHFDLGVNAQSHGDVRTALQEYLNAVQFDPNCYQAENALGVLYHLSFRQPAVAEKHYQRALQIKPTDSATKVNLAALYLDQQRYGEAIALDEQVIADLEYKKQYLPANNEGWAYFKKGDAARALQLIQDAVRSNPGFCQGYRNLGLIYESQDKLDLSALELSRMVKKCPDSAQGWYDLGRLQLRQHQADAAKKSFAKCRDASKEGDPLLDGCAKLAGSPSGATP